MDIINCLSQASEPAATQNVGKGSNDGPSDGPGGELDETAGPDPDNGGVGLGDAAG
jgi:hypothetical protein